MRLKFNLKAIFSVFLIILFNLIFTIVISEALLAVLNYHGKNYSPYPWNVPSICRFDPILGWRPNPGVYVFPPKTWTVDGLTLTINPDGSRGDGFESDVLKPSLLAIGCSVTQGWEISDNQTFMHKLQDRYPNFHSINLGCLGYGTYQSFLLLQDYINHVKTRPAVVVYGYIQHHENRNVADIDWLFYLTKASRMGHVYLPFCLMDKNQRLQCYSPEAYPQWFLDKHSRLVAFLKDLYLKWKYQYRVLKGNAVTKSLLVKMDAWCREKGIKFVVVLLQASDSNKNDYVKFLKDREVSVVDCTDPRSETAQMKVNGGSHNNERMQDIWASCIDHGFQKDSAVRFLMGDSSQKELGSSVKK